jgi:hypothetical protein
MQQLETLCLLGLLGSDPAAGHLWMGHVQRNCVASNGEHSDRGVRSRHVLGVGDINLGSSEPGAIYPVGHVNYFGGGGGSHGVANHARSRTMNEIDNGHGFTLK